MSELLKRWRCRHWHRWFRLRGESTWVRDTCRHCAVELPSPFGDVSGAIMSNTYNHRGRLAEQKWEPPRDTIDSLKFLRPPLPERTTSAAPPPEG